MTSPERRALLFLAAVAVLGIGARLAGTEAEGPAATVESRRALARQIAAVDSARADQERRKRERKGGEGRADRRRRTGTLAMESGAARDAPPLPAGPVDVDRASAEELERLPGIGPALARRIVEERDRDGPFGSAAALERVRGIGPKLVGRLRDRVTFSGVPRLPGADGGSLRTAPAERRARRPPPE
jgi:competence ComEA-like helix-hairpin-helix protein